MCGRYVFWKKKPAGQLLEALESLNRRGLSIGLKTEGEIFPTDITPVIANNRRLEAAAFAMRWGYRLPGGGLLINARSETAADKPLFRESMRCRRCLLPMDCYYEWEHSGAVKQKYEISPRQNGFCFLAGIYRIVQGEAEFAVLTRAPAESIAFIHNRMPVMLPEDSFRDWLSPDSDPRELLDTAITDVIWHAV